MYAEAVSKIPCMPEEQFIQLSHSFLILDDRFFFFKAVKE